MESPREPGQAAPAPAASAIDHEEHVANLVRFRKAAVLGGCIWAAFGPLDILAVSGHWHHLLWLELYRAVGLVGVAASVIRMRATRAPEPLELLVWQTGLFTLASALLGLMALELGTISSPYASGVLVVLMAHQLVSAHPWRRALIPTLLIAAGYPLVLAAAPWFRPEVRLQFANPVEVNGFAILQENVAAAVVVLLVGGQTIWALRRKVFANRALGRYRLLRRIGAGGMGDVWAAHHAGIQREVALKIVRAGPEGEKVSLVRFEREVRAMTALSHPNTVRVFDYGVTDDGLRYYAMELLDGEDLAHLVLREGPLSPARAVRLVSQAARALAEAHARGIVHRDVKPENLFVARLGGEIDVVKVLDFGIAHSLAPEASNTVTSTGTILGTPRFMPPEAFMGGNPTPAGDVYALGAVLYFALAGRPPFEQREAGELLIAHHKQTPPPAAKKRGEALPAELESLLARCLEKDPAKRFVDGAALAKSLDEILCKVPDRPYGAGPALPVESEAITAATPRPS